MRFECGNKGVLLRRVDEDVVWRDADLPGIGILSKENPLRRKLNVVVRVDVDGRFSAELEREGRQVLCGCRCDDTGDATVARIRNCKSFTLIPYRG